METKRLLKEALAELMGVDGVSDLEAVKGHVLLARANVRRAYQRLVGAAPGKVVGIHEREVAHG